MLLFMVFYHALQPKRLDGFRHVSLYSGTDQVNKIKIVTAKTTQNESPRSHYT